MDSTRLCAMSCVVRDGLSTGMASNEDVRGPGVICVRLWLAGSDS